MTNTVYLNASKINQVLKEHLVLILDQRDFMLESTLLLEHVAIPSGSSIYREALHRNSIFRRVNN
jgi:hypothetical protein